LTEHESFEYSCGQSLLLLYRSILPDIMTAVLHRSDSALPAFGHFRPSHCSSTPYESQQQVMDPHHYGYRAPTRTVSDDTRTTSTVTSTFHDRAPQQPYVPFSSPSSSTPRTPIAPQTLSAYPGATQQPPSRPYLPLAPQISSLHIPASLEPIAR
jgi:hypothetical protein